MPGPREDSWSERRYRRMGGAYLWLFPGGVLVTALLNITIGSGLAVLLLELPAREFLPVFTRALLTTAVWMALFLVWGPVVMRPAVRWVRGERELANAPAVWRAATAGLWRLILLGIVSFAICSFPLVLYVNRAASLPGYGIALVALGVQLVVGGVALVNYFEFEALARPVLRDVSRLLPHDFEIPRRGAGLAVKILAASVIITAYGGILLIGATSRVDGALPLLGVGIGILIFVTLTLGLPLSALLARSVVSPVEQLVSASQEVAAGDLMTQVPLTSHDELGTLSQSFNEMVLGLREREALRAAMGAYVDPVVARRILAEGQLLEGVETEVTVMFLDVRDFTARSERMTPTETVAFLNALFGLAVPVVHRHGGHVNKFLGDGLLAVFGAPEPMENHAAKAVAAAREIVRRVGEIDGNGTRLGVGLNSGPVIAGTVGGGAHLEFGLIGDTVNVAARIEQLTKETGDAILVSDATRKLVKGLRGQRRGEVAIRGRQGTVTVFAVGATEGRAPTRKRVPARPVGQG